MAFLAEVIAEVKEEDSLLVEFIEEDCLPQANRVSSDFVDQRFALARSLAISSVVAVLKSCI
jgi:hypothetical protein